MKIKKYGMKELARARALQKECVDLHLPSPPVLWWDAKITDTDGELLEHIQAKANSYTRNALNILAWHVGICSDAVHTPNTFGDGCVNVKGTNGTLYTNFGDSVIGFGRSMSVYLYIEIRLGGSSAAESLDGYVFPTNVLTSVGSIIHVTTFDTPTRKLITTLTKQYRNDTALPINVTEASINFTSGASNDRFLMVRDVFTPISVAAGKTITWTYTTEVAYPNP